MYRHMGDRLFRYKAATIFFTLQQVQMGISMQKLYT